MLAEGGYSFLISGSEYLLRASRCCFLAELAAGVEFTTGILVGLEFKQWQGSFGIRSAPSVVVVASPTAASRYIYKTRYAPHAKVDSEALLSCILLILLLLLCQISRLDQNS